MARIGIYAGTFDPVHAGHVSLALQSLEAAELGHIYFLPERQPHNKKGVEHYGHRMAMLERALRPHPRLSTLDLPDVNLNTARTLTRIEQLYPGDQLVFIFGSDAVQPLPEWPHSKQLLKRVELVVGIREVGSDELVKQAIAAWPQQPKQLTFIKSYAPEVSSTNIRQALSQHSPAQGLLSSVVRYSNRHWLYVSLAKVTQNQH